MTLDQIKRLDAGEGEEIPTLKELIKITRKRLGLQIEIKASNLLDKLIQILQEENLLETSIISSFMSDELFKLKLLEPSLKLGLLLPVELKRSNSIKRKIEKIAENDFAHKHGLKVIVWAVNDRKIMEKLIVMGVDGIITNNISLANDVIGR
jgi:glycerophosphoryl diester phosphodiesterase